MSDFEKAIRKSLSQVFLSATVDSSYFHFCQTILRWVRENGLKTAYEAGTFDAATRTYTPTSPVRVWICRFMQLTFLPVDLVASSFEQILELIPPNLELDDFLAYFQTTWIQGVTTARTSKPTRYPPSWNLVGQHRRGHDQ